jgi:hypothetical protein
MKFGNKVLTGVHYTFTILSTQNQEYYSSQDGIRGSEELETNGSSQVTIRATFQYNLYFS